MKFSIPSIEPEDIRNRREEIQESRSMYNKPVADIHLTGKATIFPRSDMRQRRPQLLLSFNTVREVLATRIRQDKFIKRIQIRKEEAKLYLFGSNMVLFTLKRP